MSDPASNQILAELQEDYRREQFHSWMRQYGGFVLGLAVLAVVATAGYTFWQHRQEAKMQAVTTELYKGLGKDAALNPTAAADTLKAFAETHANSEQAVLATLLEAGLRQQAAQPAEAMQNFASVMGNAKADAGLKAAATMAYAQLALDSDTPPADIQAKLEPYQANDHDFRFQAWELGALAASKAGDHDKAQMLLGQLINDQATPATVKERATELQRVL